MRFSLRLLPGFSTLAILALTNLPYQAQAGEQLLLRAKVNSNTAACAGASNRTEGNYKTTLLTDSENWITGVKVADLIKGKTDRFNLIPIAGTDAYSFHAVFYRKFFTNLVTLTGNRIDRNRPIKLSLRLMHRWNGGVKLNFRVLPLELRPEGSAYVLYSDLPSGRKAFDEIIFESLCENDVERGIGKLILKRGGSTVDTIDVASELR